MIELVFSRYKSDECLDRTGVQGDFSVIESEFVNFVATLATCRMLRKAGRAGLLDKMSYAELLDDLSSAWRRVDAPSDPSTGDGFWVHTLKTVFEEPEALGPSKPILRPEPKKRGRKPTPKKAASKKTKRPVGRPRKQRPSGQGVL